MTAVTAVPDGQFIAYLKQEGEKKRRLLFYSYARCVNGQK